MSFFGRRAGFLDGRQQALVDLRLVRLQGRTQGQLARNYRSYWLRQHSFSNLRDDMYTAAFRNKLAATSLLSHLPHNKPSVHFRNFGNINHSMPQAQNTLSHSNHLPTGSFKSAQFQTIFAAVFLNDDNDDHLSLLSLASPPPPDLVLAQWLHGKRCQQQQQQQQGNNSNGIPWSEEDWKLARAFLYQQMEVEHVNHRVTAVAAVQTALEILDLMLAQLQLRQQQQQHSAKIKRNPPPVAMSLPVLDSLDLVLELHGTWFEQQREQDESHHGGLLPSLSKLWSNIQAYTAAGLVQHPPSPEMFRRFLFRPHWDCHLAWQLYRHLVPKEKEEQQEPSIKLSSSSSSSPLSGHFAYYPTEAMCRNLLEATASSNILDHGDVSITTETAEKVVLDLSEFYHQLVLQIKNKTSLPSWPSSSSEADALLSLFKPTAHLYCAAMECIVAADRAAVKKSDSVTDTKADDDDDAEDTGSILQRLYQRMKTTCSVHDFADPTVFARVIRAFCDVSHHPTVIAFGNRNTGDDDDDDLALERIHAARTILLQDACPLHLNHLLLFDMVSDISTAFYGLHQEAQAYELIDKMTFRNKHHGVLYRELQQLKLQMQVAAKQRQEEATRAQRIQASRAARDKLEVQLRTLADDEVGSPHVRPRPPERPHNDGDNHTSLSQQQTVSPSFEFLFPDLAPVPAKNLNDGNTNTLPSPPWVYQLLLARLQSLPVGGLGPQDIFNATKYLQGLSLPQNDTDKDSTVDVNLCFWMLDRLARDSEEQHHHGEESSDFWLAMPYETTVQKVVAAWRRQWDKATNENNSGSNVDTVNVLEQKQLLDPIQIWERIDRYYNVGLVTCPPIVVYNQLLQLLLSAGDNVIPLTREEILAWVDAKFALLLERRRAVPAVDEACHLNEVTVRYLIQLQQPPHDPNSLRRAEHYFRSFLSWRRKQDNNRGAMVVLIGSLLSIHATQLPNQLDKDRILRLFEVLTAAAGGNAWAAKRQVRHIIHTLLTGHSAAQHSSLPSLPAVSIVQLLLQKLRAQGVPPDSAALMKELTRKLCQTLESMGRLEEAKSFSNMSFFGLRDAGGSRKNS